MKARIDKYDLYEKTVQDAPGTALMIRDDYRKLRGKPAVRFREDFAGTGALAAAWCRRNKRNTAMAVDLDPVPLKYGLAHHMAGIEDRIEIVEGDVLEPHGKNFDIIVAFNYSWLIFKTRKTLAKYFARARDALAPDGIFELDLYGGRGAIEEGEEETKMKGWTYVWHQQKFDPTTHDTRCAIHWKLPGGRTLRNSFVYEWRLWSIPEVLEIWEDVGLRVLEIQAEDDSPVEGRYRKVKRVPNWEQWNVKILGERVKR